jgi:hypothetical protein
MKYSKNLIISGIKISIGRPITRPSMIVADATLRYSRI